MLVAAKGHFEALTLFSLDRDGALAHDAAGLFNDIVECLGKVGIGAINDVGKT